jgi:hypothetical protein
MITEYIIVDGCDDVVGNLTFGAVPRAEEIVSCTVAVNGNFSRGMINIWKPKRASFRDVCQEQYGVVPLSHNLRYRWCHR